LSRPAVWARITSVSKVFRRQPKVRISAGMRRGLEARES
jgi:hypothetical protein